jgi:hypothetical protein
MGKSPERVIRIGSVSASVFVQTSGTNGDAREFRTVSMQRSYRDKDSEKTKYASNFTLSDLPAAIRCMQLAQEHVEEAEVGSPAEF